MNAISLAIAIAVLLIALLALMLWLKKLLVRFLWSRHTWPKMLVAARKDYEARILNPDWAFYERHLQRPTPKALRELYADRTLVTAQGLEYPKTGQINTFNPLDEQALLDTRPSLGFDAVAIATSNFGDSVYLRPGKSEPDTVYVTHHDGSDAEVFAETVAAMGRTNPKSQSLRLAEIEAGRKIAVFQQGQRGAECPQANIRCLAILVATVSSRYSTVNGLVT